MFYYYLNGYNPYQGYPPGYYLAPQYQNTVLSPYRQQTVRGRATWTDGGGTTKCGIPWSDNQYMTVAVGENAPYQCGQSLKIRNLANGREIIATVVDTVRGFPQNNVNLHRRAFQALGANLDQGIISVDIIPSPELEEEKWGKYLLELVQTAYPGVEITDYSSVGKTEMSPTRVRETYDFILNTQQEQIRVRGNVIYNPESDRVISFDLAEM
ncbi:DUF3889 domain-containing protein [Ornithinibacillus contaminans]|uniref:DUF3889 domain-containing protein n=1 Tax=Ornithinibacillus contaminans TaxID=694055 RepID=UPI00064DA2A2|nr:DUF3889 domain-containing protein [Ornithinibacillus contaminans]